MAGEVRFCTIEIRSLLKFDSSKLAANYRSSPLATPEPPATIQERLAIESYRARLPVMPNFSARWDRE